MAQDNPGIRAIDVGSFPLDADMSRYENGARLLEKDPSSESEDALYFIERHNEVFLAKSSAMGPSNSVTGYAQCRGMITQFLEPLFTSVSGHSEKRAAETVTKSNAQMVAGAIAMGQVSLESIPIRIGEVIALQRDAKRLSASLDTDVISYKACITGPLELTLNLQRLAGFPRGYDERLMDFFTDLVERYVKSAVTNSEYLKLEVVTMDDPSFGLEGLGDFFTDTRTDDSLNHMISCWNRIYSEVPNDCYRGLHLHTSPYEHLFEADWNLLEAHVGVYVEPAWLQNNDKYVRAAVVKTDGPSFAKDEDLKSAWNKIKTGNYEPYLQPSAIMVSYLEKNIRVYGSERVPFAGPECGLGSWDWQYGAEMALSNLRFLGEILGN